VNSKSSSMAMGFMLLDFLFLGRFMMREAG
jgi:hypothetical protein